MKPLWILLTAFALSLIGTRLLFNEWDYFLFGNIAMSVMLLFTAIGHFAFTKGMTMMLPDFIPFKTQVIFITGLVEMAAAAGLLMPSLRETTAILLVVFFALILPANVYSTLKRVDYQKGTYEGPCAGYLWFRVPLQLFLLVG